MGKGTRQAVKNIHAEIAPAIRGSDASRQAEVDQKLIRPRWHAEQGASRRQCNPGGLYGDGAGRGADQRPSPLSISWRC
jgi:hypothetical protein